MAQAQPCVYVITSFLVIFYQSTRDVFLLFCAWLAPVCALASPHLEDWNQLRLLACFTYSAVESFEDNLHAHISRPLSYKIIGTNYDC